jgi:hypothetical protein
VVEQVAQSGERPLLGLLGRQPLDSSQASPLGREVVAAEPLVERQHEAR